MDNLIQMLFWAVKPMYFADPAAPVAPPADPPPAAPPAAPPDFQWKGQLVADYSNSATLKPYPDTKEGLNNVVKSHLELEKLLGHEKVPIPKDANDEAGWAQFTKALGIPEKPEGYELEDSQTPESLKGVTFDKARFAEIVHKHKLTPAQAKGLWADYTAMTKDTYATALKEHQTKMDTVKNQLRVDWGDAYDTNVELGQMVINRFSTEKGMEDFITASLLKEPMGVKFLSRIGSQFAENKIGDFGYKRFALTPDQAQSEIDAIVTNEKHPYNNDKSIPAERERAIEYVNSLYAVLAKAKR